VEVLTLVDGAPSPSWRRVAAPAGSSCWLPAGVVSDGQATYWINHGGGDRLMSFDLTDERVATITSLPVAAKNLNAGCLRKARGRLCVGNRIHHDYQNNTEIDVCILLSLLS
jgi:sugar lactone lactonase YvrE